ncbi:MAG: formyl transferase [Magnetococcales bacterium]|nr:formyl transferase [Magnetococcales bacterium]
MESPLSVLILCGNAPRHRYVANQVIATGRVVGVVQEVGSRPTWGKAWRLLTSPAVLYGRLVRRFRERSLRLGEREARFFFEDQPARLNWQGPHLAATHINHPEVSAMVARLQPDLIFVFGTSLIREPLLSAARVGMINLHGGLSPHYRGADCIFWALSNGEPEQAGCTLHFIDAGIDTGRLVAHVMPAVTPEDDENTLFWRGVRDAAAVMAELPARLARGERYGVTQTEKGSLYTVKARTPEAQRRLELLLAQGLLRGVKLPARVRWYPVA